MNCATWVYENQYICTYFIVIVITINIIAIVIIIIIPLYHKKMSPPQNYWVGQIGMQHTFITDAIFIRDELLKY